MMGKRKLINYFLIVLALAVALVMVLDFIRNRPGRKIVNPYNLDVSEYELVDSSDIISREFKTIQLSASTYKGIDYHDGLIYVISENQLTVIDKEGIIFSEISLPDKPTAIAVDEDIWIAFTSYIIGFDKAGKEIFSWEDYGSRSVITSLAVYGEYVYVADAGNRIIYQCVHDGTLIRRIGEKGEDPEFSGFVIPSPYFEVDVNSNGVLWATNPGKHSLVSFHSDGAYRSSWSRPSVRVEGFCGCCNPSHFSLLEDDSFVTSEKKLLRIKRHDEHGEFRGVFAAPEMFDRDGLPSDICVDENGNVIVLDISRKQIRMFESVID